MYYSTYLKPGPRCGFTIAAQRQRHHETWAYKKWYPSFMESLFDTVSVDEYKRLYEDKRPPSSIIRGITRRVLYLHIWFGWLDFELSLVTPFKLEEVS